MLAVTCQASMPVVEWMTKLYRVDDKNVLDVGAADLALFTEDVKLSRYLKDLSETSLYDVAGEASDVFLEAASRYMGQRLISRFFFC